MTLPSCLPGRLLLAASLIASLAAGATSVAAAQPPRGGPPPQERRFREGIAQVVQRRLQLSDAQARQLAESNRKFADRRQLLFQRERQVRVELRRELSAQSAADEARVATLLDQLLDVQRQRLDLVSAEQRDLARFLTPVQRAKYLVLQDQVRRRVDRAVEDSGPRPRRWPK